MNFELIETVRNNMIHQRRHYLKLMHEDTAVVITANISESDFERIEKALKKKKDYEHKRST